MSAGESSTAENLSVSTSALQNWMHKVLQRKGLFAVDADLLIARLWEAEARGRPAGGLAAFEEIVAAIDAGDIDPRARTLTVVDQGAVAVIDGSTGAGQVGASRGMLLAIQKAQALGLALVLVKNSQPCRDVAVIAEMAAAAGCLGWCTSNVGKATVPLDEGGPAWLGTHPQAWALPDQQKAWVSYADCTDGGPTPSLAGMVRGVVSLAMTAGLTGSRLPSSKKRASPFGAGAEHACLAVHSEVFGGGFRFGEELAAQEAALRPVWQAIPLTPLPEALSLSSATMTALHAVATQTRVPIEL